MLTPVLIYPQTCYSVNFVRVKKKILQCYLSLGGENAVSEVHLSALYISGRIQQRSWPIWFKYSLPSPSKLLLKT